MQASLYQELEQRGILKQCTGPALAQVLEKQKVTLYCGFDPTSDSLHVGSLLPLLTLRRFQTAGHTVIGVVGGATGMIGDPSGKSQERSLLSPEQLAFNQKGITQVIEKFLDLKGSKPGLGKAQVANNADWFSGMSFVEFLRDTGKHFTVNHMLAKESVRARLEDREHGISYTEFSYMLLQAYDFYHLHKTHGCHLQIGGSDQWGNITAGIELIRRMRAVETPGHAASVSENDEVFGLTHPLVSKSDGTKFGKSESGTVWLDPKKTSPYQFYQFWIQTADADIGSYLRFFSFKPLQEIEELEKATRETPEKRIAQTALAREMTAMVHGQAEVERAEKASQALFGAEIRELDPALLRDVFAGAPQSSHPKTALSPPKPLVDWLVESTLCTSKGAARKDIQGGGVYVNNERVTDPAATLSEKDLLAGNVILLRKGKKTYHVIEFIE